jgi:hypothetical protein
MEDTLVRQTPEALVGHNPSNQKLNSMVTMRKAIGLLCYSIVLISVPSVEANGPTTAASQPLLVAPLDAALCLAHAIDDGDAPRTSRCIIGNETEKAYVAAMAEMAKSHQRLHQIIAKTFHPQNEELLGGYWALPNCVESVQKSMIKESGDRAEVIREGGHVNWKLRRIDGQWYVDIAASFPGMDLVKGRALLHNAAIMAEELGNSVLNDEIKSYAETKDIYSTLRRSIDNDR